MIVKIFNNGTINDEKHFLIGNVDVVEKLEIEHRCDCNCGACVSYRGGEADPNKDYPEMFMPQIRCFRNNPAIATPDGSIAKDCIFEYLLCKDDHCYVMNDDGKTIERIK